MFQGHIVDFAGVAIVLAILVIASRSLHKAQAAVAEQRRVADRAQAQAVEVLNIQALVRPAVPSKTDPLTNTNYWPEVTNRSAQFIAESRTECMPSDLFLKTTLAQLTGSSDPSIQNQRLEPPTADQLKVVFHLIQKQTDYPIDAVKLIWNHMTFVDQLVVAQVATGSGMMRDFYKTIDRAILAYLEKTHAEKPV